MTDDIEVNDSIRIPASELSWRFSRSSGPGGQGVNTTDSRVQLTFDVVNSPTLPGYLRTRMVHRLGRTLVGGAVVITAAEHRSQLQNRRSAQQRLAQLLREAAAPPPPSRRSTRPSRASKERRLKAKKTRGQTKRLRQSRDRDAD